MPSAQPDVNQSTAVDVITIPRPHVPFGPEGLPAEAADAAYLRRAARDLEKHYKPFGKNLRATVVKLVHDAAEAITAGGTSMTPEFRVLEEQSPRNTSHVLAR